METELDWWAIILLAGPGNDRDRAIARARMLAKGPRSDRYVERAAYALGILLKWEGRQSSARRALEAYVQRYGDDGRYTQAARHAIEDL